MPWPQLRGVERPVVQLRGCETNPTSSVGAGAPTGLQNIMSAISSAKVLVSIGRLAQQWCICFFMLG